MKFAVAIAALVATPADSLTLKESPVAKVVQLLSELKAGIEADGAKEQRSYNKFACWCEDTLAKKAHAITSAKDEISTLQKKILKLRAGLASHKVAIDQLTKDITKNKESKKEAEELRAKEKTDYAEGKVDAEQCINALDAAIKVLSNVHATDKKKSKKNFLETMQEAQLISVAEGVGNVLPRIAASSKADPSDLDVLRHFARKPDDFVGNHGDDLIAAQVSKHPYGDYAPGSGQILGILKGMRDTWSSDMDKGIEEEAKKQKAYQELMNIKKSSSAALEATMTKTQGDDADKTKELAESKATRDNTKEQLAADEDFFAESKSSCKAKAATWSERVRLRTEELASMEKAIGILSSEEATTTFDSATSSFVQLRSDDGGIRRTKAYKRLAALATQYHSMSLANIAAAVSTTGHFDKVIIMVDKMLEMLRKEDAEDIAHRDRCQDAMNKNKNEMEDIEYDISTGKKKLERMETDKKESGEAVKALEDDLQATKTNIEDAKKMRTDELNAFRKGLKDDMDAIDLLNKAIHELTAFYKENKLPVALVQVHSHHSGADEPAPETTFQGSYGGKKSESKGVISILHLIKEDLEREVEMAKKTDATAAEAFIQNRNALQKSQEIQRTSKAQGETELADKQSGVADQEEHIQQQKGDLSSADEVKKSLNVDCAWVKSHFDSRAKQRKAEMDGLIEAKNYLAGVDAGTEIDA